MELIKENIIKGRFEANTKGFGFILHPDGDIFIRSDKLNGALHGDIVEARIRKGRRSRSLEGIVTKVIKRSITEIIGRVVEKNDKKWLIPADRRIRSRFLIQKAQELTDGQMIVAKITKYPPKGLVELVEILGDEHSPALEIEIIIREHNLRIKWPDEIREQVARLPDKVRAEDIKGRKDYRSDYVVTIDGLDAKDFDDAVSISKKSDNYQLTVHIADVSAYVNESSPLDIEAIARGNSTYLVDRVIPMFPFELSNGLASLNPNVDRLTLSVESTISPAGDVLDFEIHEGVINSKARLTYEEVDQVLKSKKFADKKQEDLLLNLLELQQILEKKRYSRGTLLFETIEPKVLLDENLNPQEIIVRKRTPATSIIEEMMIVTNEIVAGYMTKRRYPVIYRWHEEPAEDALTELEGMLLSFNYPVKNIKKVDHETYQGLIKFAQRRPEKMLINMVLIRSMQKARYSALNHFHFGLASSNYCHFTSPIRRYADLIVHRQVKRMLAGELDFDKDELTKSLEKIAESISITEVESTAAERESVDMMIAQHMEDKVGEIYEAIVTSVTNFGLFVQIPNSAEGLVHITSLADDYYVFEAERYLIRGRRTGKVYRLGQKLKVQLVKVVVGERQLDFQIVEK